MIQNGTTRAASVSASIRKPREQVSRGPGHGGAAEQERATSVAGTALTVVGSGPPPRLRAVPARFAPFLAHLIATADGLPQTRERRRTGSMEGATAYDPAGSPKGLCRPVNFSKTV